MAKYRKKPIVIEAYQTNNEMTIHTLEGDMKAEIGDYIIIGVQGEQYPCKPDIFEQTYESVNKGTNVHSNEYINKAEIIPTLHRDTKYGTYEECMDGSLCTFTMNEIDNFIESLPTIEIVHCKDCKHRGTVGIDDIDCRNTLDDWFCANGERKSNG